MASKVKVVLQSSMVCRNTIVVVAQNGHQKPQQHHFFHLMTKSDWIFQTLKASFSTAADIWLRTVHSPPPANDRNPSSDCKASLKGCNRPTLQLSRSSDQERDLEAEQRRHRLQHHGQRERNRGRAEVIGRTPGLNHCLTRWRKKEE